MLVVIFEEKLNRMKYLLSSCLGLAQHSALNFCLLLIIKPALIVAVLEHIPYISGPLQTVHNMDPLSLFYFQSEHFMG